MDKVKGLWKTNAAGFDVSSQFGFGLLYAPALIKAAKKWKTVPPQRNCTVQGEITRKEPLKRDGQITLTLKSDGCKGTANHITKLEHVQVVMTLRHRQRGVLSIAIKSPSNTNSNLLSIRPHDESKDGIKNWPFMSVQFWGENPEGVWTLTIRDNSKITAKRMARSRSFDEGEFQERSAPEVPEQDEPYKMPFRHEIELEDETEQDESEEEGRRDYAREEDENYNIFDIRSNVLGELESWAVVQYGTGE